MNACIQSGKEYKPHEQMNIAYLAACLADSVKQAFIERFVEVAPQGGGGVAPQSSRGDDFFDRLNTIGTQPPVVHEIDQALAKFHSASKPTAQFRPTPPNPK